MSNVMPLRTPTQEEQLIAQLQEQLADAQALIAHLQHETLAAAALAAAAKKKAGAPEDWNPEILAANGWERDFDASLRSTPYFEILRDNEAPAGTQGYLLLLPEVFDAPLHIDVVGELKFHL